jgi:hypothetical protein
MDLQIVMPSKAGQICQILNPLDDENPEDIFIVAEDPEPFDREDNIYVVNLRDFQRNIKNPSAATQIAVTKSDLNVIAESLEKYILAWNK